MELYNIYRKQQTSIVLWTVSSIFKFVAPPYSFCGEYESKNWKIKTENNNMVLKPKMLYVVSSGKHHTREKLLFWCTTN